MLTASLLWIGVAVILAGGSGTRTLLGTLKGGDFIHFYTLGQQALTGDGARLYDESAQFALQTALVPSSADMHFLIPAYPPQIALLFAPFAGASYAVALTLWTAVIIMTYLWVVTVVRRGALPRLHDGLFVVAAAAGFPPFVELVLHGQTTVVPLLAFCLGWLALERRRPFVAGLAFGLLAAKPHLGLALGTVALMCREWRVIAGAVVAAGMQLALVVALLGTAPVVAYADTMWRLPAARHLIEPKPYQLHSVFALTDLLPAWASTPAWLLCSVAVLIGLYRIWRSAVPVGARLGLVLVGTVLVTPHLMIYDVTVLVLAFAWIGGWLEDTADRITRQRYWTGIYGLYAAYLFPIAAVIKLQPSVLLLGWLFALVYRTVRRTHGTSGAPRLTSEPP